MTGAMPFYSTHHVENGVTEVHIRSGPTSEIIVTMRSDLVGTDAGDEIIRRALAAHRAAHDVVHGEGS